MAREPLRGVFPALTTPFDEEGRLSPEFLGHNVGMLCAAPIAGFVVLGTTGEFPHLTPEERGEVIRTVAAEAGGLPVIAQTGEASTAATIAGTERAAEAGATHALILPPFYYRGELGEEALRRHYEAVADASPIPILLYHIPSHTGVDLSPALVADLSQHDRIVGIKDSSGNAARMAAYARHCRPGFTLLTGSLGAFLPCLVSGATGAVLGLAGLLPFDCCELFQAYADGDLPSARARQERLAPIGEAIGARGIAGLKFALDLLGYFGGPPRPPLLPIGEEERDDLRGAFVAAGLTGC